MKKLITFVLALFMTSYVYSSDLRGIEILELFDENINYSFSTEKEITHVTNQVLVNKYNYLDPEYIPDDLRIVQVPFIASSDERMYMSHEAATQLEYMFQKMKEEELDVVAVSGYRSYLSQEHVHEMWLNEYGDTAKTFSAEPGFSEHQTGLAMDVSTQKLAGKITPEFSGTEAYQWIEKHAHEYGYIVRYPRNKKEITGYVFESFHLRYVGKELSGFLYHNQMTLEELYAALQYGY